MTDTSFMSRRALLAGMGAGAGALAAAPLLARPAAAAAGADDWAATVAAAEAEGKLTLLGPAIQPYRLSILEFQKAYPKIQFEYTGGTSPEFEARLRNERRVNLFLWDLMVAGVSGSVYTEQIPAGWYDPIRPLITRPGVVDDAAWIGGFEGGFLDAGRTHVFAFQAGLQNNLNIDRAQIPEAELSSLDGLLDPKWAGRIAILDPRNRGSGHLVTLLLSALGEEKTRAFLADQKLVLAGSNRQLADWVAQGAYPITSGLSPSEIATLHEKGLAREVRALKTPPAQTAWTPGWGAVALLHKAPHPNAAKVFVNWLLSREAQADWAKRGFVNSRRKDVEPGLPISAIDEQSFREGITFNAAATAEVAQRAFALAKDVLR
ncbi:iron(III) transport system substrate-binding protein [Azospirillum baldaniorum]|uniref:ABC transporter substrate-binding protein n=1 Tax=Azospirillum baldaniorum TaxID=1064539 RepID=UPI0011AC2BC8|nr:extracellular solute-binding protein [Azospirillum baldaniorum]TWA57331.1 iron(III) transport system substrate-binding protein [Azospirillum baldaniorum]